MMRAVISGVGTGRPEQRLKQRDAATMAKERCANSPRQERATPAIYRMTTVRQRASALLSPNAAGVIDAESFDRFYTPRNGRGLEERGPTTAQRMQRFLELAPPLATHAARAALADAGIDGREITHLVIVTCTGFGSPGVDFALIEALGLSPDVSRTQVGFMGCHGLFNGLAVADAFARADPTARVLLVSVELCSLHFQYGWDTQRVVANALFADGAAAMVLGQEPATPTHGAVAPTLTVESLTRRWIPDTKGEMSWHVGDHGFTMTLASTVPAAIGSCVRAWIERWLSGHGLTIGEVGGWAIHPGGPRIVTSVAEALGLDAAAVAESRRVLATCGNMSSATIGFIIDALRRSGTAGPIVGMSFGPGLAAEAALLRSAAV